MYCSECGNAVGPGAQYCGQCGASIAARPALPLMQPTIRRRIIPVVLSVVALVVLAVGHLDVAAAPETKGVFPFTWPCATERGDAAKIYVAMRDQDLLAIAGLVDRGKAFEVHKGDHFTSLGHDRDGIGVVLITSGYHVHQVCYLPATYIARWKD
jgi:zinc-ribbon domain